MAKLIIGIGEPPKGKVGKADPMGSPPEGDSEPDVGSKDSSSEVRAALGDAFDATKGGDRETFIDAIEAALTAKFAELHGEDEA